MRTWKSRLGAIVLFPSYTACLITRRWYQCQCNTYRSSAKCLFSREIDSRAGCCNFSGNTKPHSNTLTFQAVICKVRGPVCPSALLSPRARSIVGHEAVARSHFWGHSCQVHPPMAGQILPLFSMFQESQLFFS